MKKILLTIAAIALFAVPASAQVYSIWSDAEMTVVLLQRHRTDSTRSSS